MAQNAFGFPSIGLNDVTIDRAFGPPLQAAGNLTYLEFISVVKMLWENLHPEIKLEPTTGGEYASYPVIVYGLEIRKAHSVEPKPRSRQVVQSNQMVFGQRFQNVVSFTIILKSGKASLNSADNPKYVGGYTADALAEAFEDFMLEYTPVFKRLGAAELVYARRLSDSEENRSNVDIIKRTITYMLTTEKLIATSVDTIEQIAIDVRRYMAYEPDLVEETYAPSTPDYSGTEINIIDLYQTATPNY